MALAVEERLMGFLATISRITSATDSIGRVLYFGAPTESWKKLFREPVRTSSAMENGKRERKSFISGMVPALDFDTLKETLMQMDTKDINIRGLAGKSLDSGQARRPTTSLKPAYDGPLPMSQQRGLGHLQTPADRAISGLSNISSITRRQAMSRELTQQPSTRSCLSPLVSRTIRSSWNEIQDTFRDCTASAPQNSSEHGSKATGRLLWGRISPSDPCSRWCYVPLKSQDTGPDFAPSTGVPTAPLALGGGPSLTELFMAYQEAHSSNIESGMAPRPLTLVSSSPCPKWQEELRRKKHRERCSLTLLPTPRSSMRTEDQAKPKLSEGTE